MSIACDVRQLPRQATSLNHGCLEVGADVIHVTLQAIDLRLEALHEGVSLCQLDAELARLVDSGLATGGGPSELQLAGKQAVILCSQLILQVVKTLLKNWAL